MPRPSQDRILHSFYMSRSMKAWVEELARKRGESASATFRTMLEWAMDSMPEKWTTPVHTRETVE